jgi:hypothetical protein
MAIYLEEAYLAVLLVSFRQDEAAGSLASVSFRGVSNLNVLRFSRDDSYRSHYTELLDI